MSDIVEHAEAALAIEFKNGHPWPGIRSVLRELVAALKTERRHVRYLELYIQQETGSLSYAETDELDELSKEFA